LRQTWCAARPFYICRIYDLLRIFSRYPPTSFTDSQPVFNSGFFGSDSIRPFDHDAVERDLKANKFKTKDLTIAIQQALNPTEFDKEVKQLRDAQRKEEGQERKEAAKSKKKQPAAKKEPSPAKKAAPAKPAAENKTKAAATPKATKMQEKPQEKSQDIIPAASSSRKRRGTQAREVSDTTDNARDSKRSVSFK
jgi:hypothetical protein